VTRRYLPSIKHGQFDAEPVHEIKHDKECPCMNSTCCDYACYEDPGCMCDPCKIIKLERIRMSGTDKLLDKLRKEEQKLWRGRYDKQREMEKNTRWRFCPWCGSRLAIVIEGHICGFSDID